MTHDIIAFPPAAAASERASSNTEGRVEFITVVHHHAATAGWRESELVMTNTTAEMSPSLSLTLHSESHLIYTHEKKQEAHYRLAHAAASWRVS